MKVLNLLVLSRYQHVLDEFLNSLLPTINNDVKVYVISEGLSLPKNENVLAIPRTEFNPNKYFNIARKLIPEQDRGYVGIVNDDIYFSKNWLEDVIEKIERYDFISPGFVETKDKALFEKAVESTKDVEGVVQGQFDAFYVVDWNMFEALGELDETAISWYDIDFLLALNNIECYPLTSKKVTVMHLGSTSFPKEEKDLKGIKQAIISKYGNSGLKLAKENSVSIRREFKYE